jgi:glycosyltransferase involved in cell wall biosynthesis
MKILLISTSDLRGGAARSGYRLHRGLVESGIDSRMLVQTKVSDDRTVIAAQSKIQRGLANLRPTIDVLPLEFYRKRDRTPYNYAIQWQRDRVIQQVGQINPDIINLHWICGGYLQIETIAKFKKPIVWTLHDMWAFTGGCHYDLECGKYKSNCGNCPILSSNRDWDLSRWIWQRKAKALQNADLTVVTPSNWLAECAKNSSLFANRRVEVIPYGLDTQQFKPIDKTIARDILGLPQDKALVLFGASTANAYKRKGFHLLQPALQIFSNSEKIALDVELVIFGSSEPENPPNFGFKSRYMGKLNDDISLVLLYSAADVFVAPSTQDNFPNTILEALACGTPVVAFNIGGVKDQIDDRITGYIARPFEPEDLADGIKWILIDRDRHYSLCKQARVKAERDFQLKTQAELYIQLFQDILAEGN